MRKYTLQPRAFGYMLELENTMISLQLQMLQKMPSRQPRQKYTPPLGKSQ